MSKLRKTPYKKNGVIYERIYEFTLYEDSTIYEYDKILSSVTSSFDQWAYIVHDSDVNENGELKKKHTHLLFRSDNALSINSVSKQFDFPVNDIVWKSDWRESIRYLTHVNHPEKYQYNIDNIVSSYGPDIQQFFDSSLSESEQVQKLFDFCVYYEITRMVDLMSFALQNGCYSALRRGASLFNGVLRDNEKKHIQQFKKEND